MKPWQIAVLLVLACSVSAAAGFWAGFREAWLLGSTADLLPRAAGSVKHLEAMEAGNLRPVRLGLDFDVDNGLIWADLLLDHPLRNLWAPLWGLDVYPHYEQYVTRLANYRRDHPSSMRAEMFADAPGDFARSARDVAARRDAMVQRYAAPRSAN